MKINITGNNLDLTDAFKVHIEEKLDSLNKLLTHFDTDSVQAWVVVSRTTNHHKHGEDIYGAEIKLRIPGDMLQASDEAGDARVAVNNAKDKLKAILTKLKDKKTSH